MRSMKKRRRLGQPSSSASHSAEPGWTYEAFISFTGVDTRNNFVSHLYDALMGAGIATFKDDIQLDKGKSIGPELVKAIEESRSAVVVFSKHYADSSWCLDELAKIMECEQKFGMVVFPVFYDVEPSEVRKQKGDYREAFVKHENNFPDCTLRKWREALTKAANDSGWDVAKTANGNESQCVKQIVQRILSNERPYIADNLFGMEDHLRDLESVLATPPDDEVDVRFIGLWGPGGIGKTTIAQAIYGKLSYKFDGQCFVDGVRENGCDKNGLISLQNKILSKIRTVKNLKVDSLQDGMKEMSCRLRNKQVLLVLDDVDDAEQLESLAATPEWFGKGSVILITTRDENVLPSFAQVYQPHQLQISDALKLFCVYAFQQNSPPEGYKELADEVVSYADGLPLALKVVGSFMKGVKDVEEWRSAIGSLGVEPQSKIHKVLKLSYDGLSYSQQQAFLDIACFFKGQNKELATRILDSFGNGSSNQSAMAIRVLIRKSLLTIRNGDLWMHDLIQEMGCHIVRRYSTNEPKEPYEYSRLWHHNDVMNVLTNNTDNNVVQGIMLDADEEVNINPQALKRMKKLKFLDVRKAIISSELTCLPKTMRWVNWNNYPFESLPAGLRDLIGIQMLKSKVQRLWDTGTDLRMLKFVRLTGSTIKRLPDFSGAPNIERLILQDCLYLEEVHPTVGKLKKLVFLNLRNCRRLASLPPFTGMDSLETLILSSCLRLTNFPKVSGNMQKLSKIYMNEMFALKVLDPTVGDLSGLKVLVLRSCGVVCLPSTFGRLKQLKTLDLSCCYFIEELPETIGSMESLENLSLDHTSIGAFPSSFSSLKNLKSFSFCFTSDGRISSASEHFLINCLSGFSSLRKLFLGRLDALEAHLPPDLGAWSFLEELTIYESNFLRLPVGICKLPGLKKLVLFSCTMLEEVQELPCSIQILYFGFCPSLRCIRGLSTQYEWLYKMTFTNCRKLMTSQLTNRYISNALLPSRLQGRAREHQFSIAVAGRVIPDWFRERACGLGTDTVSLRPAWHRTIVGFMICYVSEWSTEDGTMLFKITDTERGNSGMWSSLNIHSRELMTSEYYKLGVWIRYMSFEFFRHIFHDVENEDWSGVQGSLVVHIPDSRVSAVRIVYKDEEKDNVDTTSGFEGDECKFDYGNLERISKNGTEQSTTDLNEEPFELSSDSAYVYEEEQGRVKRVKMDSDQRLESRFDRDIFLKYF